MEFLVLIYSSSTCKYPGLLKFCLKLKRCNIFLQITVLFLRASHILFLAEEKAKINKADCALHNDASDFYSSQILFWPSFWPRDATVTVLAVLLLPYFFVIFRNIYLLSKILENVLILSLSWFQFPAGHSIFQFTQWKVEARP